MQFQIYLFDENATKRFAEDFALCLKKNDLVTLEGDLGAGKSTFARAIIKTLADDEDLDVPSPTFTITQIYELPRFLIAHIDLYRVQMVDELEELGLEDLRKDGILLVEWPQNGEEYLQNANFILTFSHEGEGRRLTITFREEAEKRLKRSLEIREFLKKHQRGTMHRRFFTGDASARSYEILKKGKINEILMNAPEMEMPEMDIHKSHPLRNDQANPLSKAQSYAKAAHLAEDIRQFIGINQLILENGFIAPKIFAKDWQNGLLISEDLGKDLIVDKDNKPILARYCAAAKFLAHFHQKTWPDTKNCADFSITIPKYTKEVLQQEVSLLLDWYFPNFSQQTFTKKDKQEFFTLWHPHFIAFEKSEQSFVMRDYHSPNILWQAKKRGTNRIGVIDFQDGQIGATAYDVASLAQDARVKINAEMEDIILNTYCQERQKLARPFDENDFRKIYAISSAQRNSKILGIFVRLNLRDGKPHYMHYLPQIKEYLKRSLAYPDLKLLKEFYQKYKVLDHD